MPLTPEFHVSPSLVTADGPWSTRFNAWLRGTTSPGQSSARGSHETAELQRPAASPALRIDIWALVRRYAFVHCFRRRFQTARRLSSRPDTPGSLARLRGPLVSSIPVPRRRPQPRPGNEVSVRGESHAGLPISARCFGRFSRAPTCIRSLGSPSRNGMFGVSSNPR